MQADVSRVTDVLRALHTNPKDTSLAQIERHILPCRMLFSDMLFATHHPNTNVWLEKLLIVYKHHELPPLLDGEDLQAIPEGPKRGEIVNTVRSAQLAGNISTRDEALTLLAQWR